MSITLPQNYRPTERESFMNPMQQEYFRQKLLKWKNELIEESNQTLQNMQEESLAQPDLADRATAETDRSLELRTRDRVVKVNGQTITDVSQVSKAIQTSGIGKPATFVVRRDGATKTVTVSSTMNARSSFATGYGPPPTTRSGPSWGSRSAPATTSRSTSRSGSTRRSAGPARG